MTDSRMNDEASDVSENNEEDFGWQVAAGQRSRAEKKSRAVANAVSCNSQASNGDTATGGGQEGAHGAAELTEEPQKLLTLSELLEI
ncbi:hypothetical protein MRX96_003043 [Rhipicephalus microplus]